MEEGGTYLEDFLLSMESLPNPMRRDCELMRELDREVSELSQRLGEVETLFLENADTLKNKVYEMEVFVPPPAPSSSARKRTRSCSTSGDNVSFEEQELKKDRGKLEQERDQFLEEINELKARIVQRVAEKFVLVKNLLAIVDQYSNKLDADLSIFAADLKGGGEYEAPKGIPVDSEIAFYIDINRTAEKTLFLGRVVAHRSEIASYDILDIDDNQKYTLPESQIFPIGRADATKRIAKGDVLFALYPDSTSFYAATIVAAPKKTLGADATVVVQFVGDEDATGYNFRLLTAA
jgi:hypothetical protein